MASSQGVNLAINYGWALGESGWKLEMDENLLVLDALVLLAVLSATTTAPPGSPAAGDRYIVPTGGTGAWSGHDEEIAQYSGSGWNFYTAQDGWFCRAADTAQTWVFDSSNWVLEGSLLGQYASDVAAATGSVPVDGMYICSQTGAVRARQGVLGESSLLLVLSATTTAPPGSPSTGDRYIVPTGGTGAWSGHDEEIAQYDGAAWAFYPAREGLFARASDTVQMWIFVGGNWGLEASFFGQYADDTAAATGGVPVDGIYVNSSTGALHCRLT